MNFSVSCYTTTSTENSVYFFGGYPTQNNNRIAKFENHSWTEVGSLVHGRFGHGSLTIGSETMQIAGYLGGNAKNAFTEVWDIPSLSHRVIDPELENAYSGYQIGLFAVNYDFCTV